MADHVIARYDIRMHSGPQGAEGNVRASIRLADADGKVVGTIRFYDPEVGTKGVPIGEPLMTLPLAALPSVVDMLRNEKPVLFARGGLSSTLRTGVEPVGEGEG